MTADEISNLGKLLLDDVIEISVEVVSGRGRRSYVRAVFAAVEGFLELLRVQLREKAAHLLSPEQLLALEEIAYRISDSGKLEHFKSHSSLKQRVKFTTVLIRGLRPNYLIDFNAPEWGALLRGLDVRDGLVHPKQLGDMEVTFENFDDVSVGFKWFMTFLILPGHAELAELVKKFDVQVALVGSYSSLSTGIMVRSE